LTKAPQGADLHTLSASPGKIPREKKVKRVNPVGGSTKEKAKTGGRQLAILSGERDSGRASPGSSHTRWEGDHYLPMS